MTQERIITMVIISIPAIYGIVWCWWIIKFENKTKGGKR